MKRHLIHLALPAAVMMASFVQAQTAPQSTPASVLLEKAIYQEETVGDLDAAAKLYRQIVEEAKAARPQVAQAQYRLGLLLIKQKQVDDGIALLAKLESQYPDQKELIAKAKEQVTSLRRALPAVEVTKIVDKAVAAVSRMDETDPKLAGTLATLQGLDPATTVQALAKHLADTEPESRRAAIYILWMGPMDDTGVKAAFPELRKLLTHNEQLTRGMAALTLGARKDGDSLGALETLTLKDSDPYARRCGAYALGLLGNPAARETLTLAAKDKDPMVQANARAALKLLDDAAKSGAAPSPADKRAAEDYASAGWQRWFKREFADAESLFQQAVEKDGTNANYFNGLGWSQLNQGKKENARAAFEKAVALDPKAAASWNGLGWIAQGDNQKDKAVEYWTKAYNAAPTTTAATAGLAQASYDAGDYAKALDWCDKWLKYEPGSAEAKALQDKIHVAQDAVKAAMPVAEAWLKKFYAGNDEACYNDASSVFKGAITMDAWKTSGRAARALFTNPANRKLLTAQYLTQIPGGPDGEYVVIQFRTDFDKKKGALETISPQKDTDGAWRVSGYYVK